MSGKVTIFFLLLVHHLSSTCLSHDVLSLSKNETLRSPGDVFELGFFQPGNISNWYLGIWLKQDPKRSALWVANRNRPLIGSEGTLRFSNSNLVLVDRDNYQVWSTNINRTLRPNVVIKLLDNGNLVVKEDTNQFLWQSFDFPTDSLIPEMKLHTGTGNLLQAWTSPDDPTPGELLLGVTDTKSGVWVYLRGKDSMEEKDLVDLWDGYRFGDMPPIFQLEGDPSSLQQSLVMTTNHGNFSRFRLGAEGIYEVYTWFSKLREWKLTWSVNGSCFLSNECGSYSYCSEYNTASPCHCINGFKQKLDNTWTGCARVAGMSCSGDRFITLQNMKLPRDRNAFGSYSSSPDLLNCKELCLINCHCTAYAFVESRKGQATCVTWFEELEDMRNYTFGGHDLHVRIAATDPGVEDGKKESARLKPWMIVLIVAGLLFFIAFWYYVYKRKKRSTTTQGRTQTQMMMTEITGEDQLFTLMDLSTISEATNNFSSANVLGRGGFGIVYKGILPNGREVAVKRLDDHSSQGTIEFRNEVTTILNVLHKNLVRLLGCSCEGRERILVYEYLQNLSLDRYIFNEARSRLLNWATRFRIINEIAQGLSYLHNFRDNPIIHRDLKPSNVLLDSNMLSKISDFGMAKILQSGQPEAETERLVGTYGYMSKEYAVDNILSDKVDIFSFGVMILEIITGQQNIKFCNSHPGDSLLDLAWRTWSEGKGLELIPSQWEDDSLVEEEILRSVQISLCCVQQEPEDRPTMELVVLWLKSRTTEISAPKEPEYYYGRNLGGQAASSSYSAHETESSVLLSATGSYSEIVTLPR